MDEHCDLCNLPVADSLARSDEGDQWWLLCAEQYRILYRAQGLSNYTGVSHAGGPHSGADTGRRTMSGRCVLCGDADEAYDEDFACGPCVEELDESRERFMALVGLEPVADEI